MTIYGSPEIVESDVIHQRRSLTKIMTSVSKRFSHLFRCSQQKHWKENYHTLWRNNCLSSSFPQSESVTTIRNTSPKERRNFCRENGKNFGSKHYMNLTWKFRTSSLQRTNPNPRKSVKRFIFIDTGQYLSHQRN